MDRASGKELLAQHIEPDAARLKASADMSSDPAVSRAALSVAMRPSIVAAVALVTLGGALLATARPAAPTRGPWWARDTSLNVAIMELAWSRG